MRQSTENRKMQTRRKAKYYIKGKLYTLFVAVRIFKSRYEYTYITTNSIQWMQSHPKETRDDF